MMKRRISIAPPEVWELVKECYEFHDVRTKAFKTVNKKEILPRADFMNLEAKTAQELHDIGMACNPITAQDAALPVFEANVFVDAGCDTLYDLLQPANPELVSGRLRPLGGDGAWRSRIRAIGYGGVCANLR